MLQLISKGIKHLKNNGIKSFLYRVWTFFREKEDYMTWYEENKASDRELKIQRETSLSYMPKFSILVPVYQTPEPYFIELLECIKNQTYTNWELCLADGTGKETRITALANRYAKKDARIKYKLLEQNRGISGNTNAAIEMADGDFYVLGDHDDTLEPNALFECANAINQNRSIDIIYTDEDKISNSMKGHFSPHFKPDFSIDLLRSVNYICHMFVVKSSLARKAGLFRSEYDGAQDYDFIFRCVEMADCIHHIPMILYNWRFHSGSTAANPESKLYAFEAGIRAIKSHYDRVGIDAEVVHGYTHGIYRSIYAINENPSVSIIIPNKDHVRDLEKCIRSIQEKSTYNNFNITIVENNSTEDKTFQYYKELEEQYENIKILQMPPMESGFNYSAINNFAVKHTKGEYLLFLNNDIEIISENWIEEMLGICQRDDVGIVGARLYFENNTVQHAGVIVGLGGVGGHALAGIHRDDLDYCFRAKAVGNYSAVTAACLLTKREVFDQVGGFEEELRVAFNDLDFCLKVRELGKLVVYTPYAELYHYESISRGYEDTPEKKARFQGESDYIYKKWKKYYEYGDPYYNKNLTMKKHDFSITKQL